MDFVSILFEKAHSDRSYNVAEVPSYFKDLNLDQIVDAITLGKQEYNLKPFFYTCLKDVNTIQYRYEIMNELETEKLFEYIKSFALDMHKMRESLALADKLHYKYQKERWFLDSIELYCNAVIALEQNLSLIELKSRGFLAFYEYLTAYTKSSEFTSLFAKVNKIIADLSTVKYCMLIKNCSIKVFKYESEIDYSAEVEKTFEKFKQRDVKSYVVKFDNRSDMNYVEAGILNLVSNLYPDIFEDLDRFCIDNKNYMSETIKTFDREIQFYIAYLEYIADFKRGGLKFCYPVVSNKSKEIYVYDSFDLALANSKLTHDTVSSVICNDFYLKGKERIITISGPNQGGKTTFARVFGQVHFLASIGCPVPGREAQLFLFDNIYTHFEREEDIKNLQGKLQDDLVRIHDILEHATTNSIIIINEIFSSTSLKDAILLGKKIMEKIIQLDLLCVCVTFIDELSVLSDKNVSMVSTVVPDNPAMRTFKIVRKKADGLSYAKTIAEKYRLTYDCIKERIKL